MKLIFSLLEYPQTIPADNIYCFTANLAVNKRGDLVMGAGNALAVKNAYPDVPRWFGGQYTHFKSITGKTYTKSVFYYTTPYRKNRIPSTISGILSIPVKYHYAKPADLELVLRSLNYLTDMANSNPNVTFHLPYPAIGHGGLTVAKMAPYVEALPDNVWVYMYNPDTAKK